MWMENFLIVSVLISLSTWKLACKAHEETTTDSSPECKSVAGVMPDGNQTRELVCLHGLPYSFTEGISGSFGLETVSGLTVLNWRDEEFDAARALGGLPELRRLSILNGNLQRIVTPFPEDARLLEVVEISGTSLRAMPEFTFAGLPELRTLDLRNNALGYLDPDDLIAVPKLRDVYLAGNQWTCNENSVWLVNSSYGSLVERVVDRDEMRCWSPFKGKPLLFVMEVMQRLQDECQQLVVCDCELVYVVNSATLGGGSNGSPMSQQQQTQQQTSPRQHQRQFMAFATVNCSHRGFTDMPAFLPANTTTLHLEGNQISDLTPLKINPVYKSVIDLYLDDNEVECVGLLDGTFWLEHFRLLSLRVCDVRVGECFAAQPNSGKPLSWE
ncbi:protein singed wings 2 isoform X2 [Copidosoma floridanum]|uniref:protein singed wings 2 isoform X2 n=1 Tax=Copidosoma floridanum TaxID=29053 RepID=UPI0006C994BE|nr:protein singed wings 2 isoform X2 [Copidosoma floridanum]